MKPLLLLLIITTVACAAEESIDGTYYPWDHGVLSFYSESIELKDGRFALTVVSDVAGKTAEKGTYRRFGKRIVLLGDKEDFGELWFFTVHDGISLLVQTSDFRLFLRQMDGTARVLVRLDPKNANVEGVKRLLEQHPKLKEILQHPR
jgi:hypothetical protein